MQTSYKAGLAVAAFLFAAPIAHAQTTVFNTFGPGIGFDPNSYYDDLGPVQQPNQTDYTYQSLGFTFVPSASGALSSVMIALSTLSNVRSLGRTTDAHIFLSEDNGGVPGSLLESYTLANLPDTGTNYTPEVLTSALHPVLTAGTTYDLYVAEPGDEVDVWNLSSKQVFDRAFDSHSPNQPYSSLALPIEAGAFSIQVAAVPEASTTASFGLLLVLGMGGRFIASRKK